MQWRKHSWLLIMIFNLYLLVYVTQVWLLLVNDNNDDGMFRSDRASGLFFFFLQVRMQAAETIFHHKCNFLISQRILHRLLASNFSVAHLPETAIFSSDNASSGFLLRNLLILENAQSRSRQGQKPDRFHICTAQWVQCHNLSLVTYCIECLELNAIYYTYLFMGSILRHRHLTI